MSDLACDSTSVWRDTGSVNSRGVKNPAGFGVKNFAYFLLLTGTKIFYKNQIKNFFPLQHRNIILYDFIFHSMVAKAIMGSMKNSKYWQQQYDSRALIVVDQVAKKGKTLNPICKVTKCLAFHPKGTPLPTVHKTTRSFAPCVPCQKVVGYGTSTSDLCGQVHTSKCKADPAVKATVPTPNPKTVEAFLNTTLQY